MSAKYIGPVFFSLWIALPGMFGLASTKLPSPDLSVISGTYQSAYEDQFSDSFLFKQVARDAFTAFKLAAFGQTDPQVVVGHHSWLFTAEEFDAPADLVAFSEVLRETKTRLAQDV
ncbi:MAG: hypothetical protein AAF340_07425 [Pseudomonadota bacterium]